MTTLSVVLPRFVLGFASVAPAQSLYGSLVGTITDESGGVLARAIVTVTQAETNFSRGAVTSDTGGYNIPNILPETYQLTVTLAGFQTLAARDVNVEANTAIRLDARVKIGEVKETISVSATAVALQTESAAVQSNATNEQLITVPTRGRSWQTTTAVMPGVATSGGQGSRLGGNRLPDIRKPAAISGRPDIGDWHRYGARTLVPLGVGRVRQWQKQRESHRVDANTGL